MERGKGGASRCFESKTLNFFQNWGLTNGRKGIILAKISKFIRKEAHDMLKTVFFEIRVENGKSMGLLGLSCAFGVG